MATFRMNDPETWLPTFAQGHGLEVKEHRLRLKDGTKLVIPIGSVNEFAVTDERVIRHLEADPRFTLVSV